MSQSFITYQNSPKYAPVLVIQRPPVYTTDYHIQQNVMKDDHITNYPYTSMKNMIQEEIKEEDVSSEQSHGYTTIYKILANQRQKKRIHKSEKLIKIAKAERDDGRGGNCIASNNCKTLNRIFASQAKHQVNDLYLSYIKMYKIKSQKESTLILFLIIYVFVRQRRVSIEKFQMIAKRFFASLNESERNCQLKMQNQESRSEFHKKNRIMYHKFIQINQKMCQILKESLYSQSKATFTLKDFQEQISKTYDRKQRDIEKAMNKIKSVIFNHQELKQLFGYKQNNLEEIFYQSIDYAFRRNLPKRCKHTKSIAQKVLRQLSSKDYLSEFLGQSSVKKYIPLYFAGTIIDEKKNQIWQEFAKNLKMKNEFNMNPDQLRELQTLLLEGVPKSFQLIPKRLIDQIEIKIEENERSSKVKSQLIEIKMEQDSTSIMYNQQRKQMLLNH